MRKLLIILIIAFVAIGASHARKGQWYMESRPGRGCWAPDCRPDQLPLGLDIVAHEDRLIMFGDGKASDRIYESANGIDWTLRKHDAAWGTRYGASAVSMNGALWRLAGFEDSASGRRRRNDVWNSTDGVHWTQVTARAEWSPRVRPRLVAFRSQLWLFGGDGADSVAWHSSNGQTWQPVETVPARASDAHRALVFRNRIWLIGGSNWDTPDNDVWSSADGVSWMLNADHAAWPARMYPGIGEWMGYLWLFGGAGHNDMWSSSDGVHWHQMAQGGAWPPRAADHHVTWNGAIWLFGGKTGAAPGYLDDVWAFY